MNFENMGTQKWYPLTNPGYYGEDREVMPSVECEHCRLDLTHFRGKSIGLGAVLGVPEGRCTLTDTEGKVLESWVTPPETLPVPQNALHLYLNNHYASNSDFYIRIPEDSNKKPTYFLFDENFTQGDALDGNDFFGDSPAKDCTPDGLLLPLGIENALVLQKSTALDDWSMTAEITLPEGNESVCLGSRITQGRHSLRHASLCCLDLAAAELILYRGSDGTKLPEEILQRKSLGGLIEKGEITLRLERVNLDIRATVINPKTGDSVSLIEHIIQEETEHSVAGGCKAGKIFDSPQVFALAGAPRIRRLYGVAKSNPKVIFFGDSITQGAHNLPENGWAQMCAAEIGDSICCGRGSGDIWSCLNQVRTLAPALCPKAMVVTIGANNREDTASLKTVKGLYEKFVHIADWLGIILILNCVTSCRPHVDETNRIIRSLGTLRSRFDLALVKDHAEGGERILDYYVSDRIHLNPEGNKVLHRLFMKDFSWLKNL